MTQPSQLHIRFAGDSDAGDIARIYNDGIRDRIATLETEVRTIDERLAWLRGRDPRHPVLVVSRNDKVIGWASLNLFNPRPAYRHVADISVYVGREARGVGAGTLLLQELISVARTLDFHKLVLAGFPWNEAALRLYKRAGFREVGTYHEQGLLDGKWVDTIIMELML